MASVGSSASVSSAKWLVGVMAAIVLAFGLATALTEYYTRTVAESANELITNAMPSVQWLSQARSDLRSLENDLELLPAKTEALKTEAVEDIMSMRQDVDEALVAYAALPFFPSERALYAHVDEDRARLDHSIDAFLAQPDERAVSRLHHEIDLVDAAIQRVVAFDAAQGQRLGSQIQSVHGKGAALAAILDAVSVLLAVFATVLALRQLRRAARARELRERELAEENAALGHFAGRVAHDVLSPLGAVQLSFDLMRETSALDANAKSLVERGERAVQRVKTLVDGLLAFSRAGGHPDPGVSTEVAPVLTDIVAELGSEARSHDIALSCGAIPAGSVACSAGVLTSIVSNLVRNAIKYMNDAGERRIELRVERLASRWRFEVQDTGPGIAVEEQRRIFEPYVQLRRGTAGIGLGLATVDRLVRAHGGAVGVTSAPERGALFWFELPHGAAETDVAPAGVAMQLAK